MASGRAEVSGGGVALQSELIGDPLLDTLVNMRVRGVLARWMYRGHPWAISFRTPSKSVSVFMCFGGRISLYSDQLGERWHLNPGDVTIVIGRVRYVLATTDSPAQLTAARELDPSHLSINRKGGELLTDMFCRSATDTSSRRFYEHFAMRLYLSEIDHAFLWHLPSIIRLPAAFDVKSSETRDAIERLLEAGRAGLLGQPLASRHGELLLIPFLIKYFENCPQFTNSGEFRYAAQFFKSLRQAEERMGESCLVSQIARDAGMSRSSFLQHFKRCFGSTPAEFLLQSRMERATSLLRSSGLSVSQISDMVGYGSPEAFNRAYHRWAGVPPGKVRQFSH